MGQREMAMTGRKETKEKKKYVKYGVCAGLVLAVCAAVFFLLRRKRKRGTLVSGDKAGEAVKAEKKLTGEKEVETEKKLKAEKEVKAEKKLKAEKEVEAEKKLKAEKEVEAEKKLKREKEVKAEKKLKTDKEAKRDLEAGIKDAENTADFTTSAEQENGGGKQKGPQSILKCAAGGLYTVLILGICAAPLALLFLKTDGGRMRPTLPEFSVQAASLWDYLPQAGDYFTEHFALRQEMVSVNSEIRSEVFGASSVEDVIVGKNGWLYYAATLDDYQHKNGVSERMLFNMAHNVALMQEYAGLLGKTMLFTIAPNKNSLYDENMPERLRYQVAEESDAERLLPWLVRENVNYVDLFRLFGEQKEVLYYARDSHWNEKGAVLVYNALLDACGKAHETYEGAKPAEKADYYGDLGVMLFPTEEKPENRLVYPEAGAWRYTEGTQVEDMFIRTESGAGEGNLLMYRDSFGNSLLPYMAQSFSQAVFSKQVPYPMTDLVLWEPDIVIVEKVERHLPTLGTVPPLMSALARYNGKECVSAENTGATVQLSKEGSYWKLEGMADPAYMDTNSRIYVEVDDGSGAKLYEAFCVSRTDKESSRDDDYGYMLYLSEVLVNGDTFRIRVMIEQEENMVVLLDREVRG